eukprot:8431796-Pyramimonas_sp.AAC.1
MSAAWTPVKAEQVNQLINDKGYTLLDIRSFEERHEAGAKSHWFHVPIAAMVAEGDYGCDDKDGCVIGNSMFADMVRAKFPNSMSRIIIVRPVCNLLFVVLFIQALEKSRRSFHSLHVV